MYPLYHIFIKLSGQKLFHENTFRISFNANGLIFEHQLYLIACSINLVIIFYTTILEKLT